MVKEFEMEIASFPEGELSLDSPQVAALLVLAVSMSFSNEWHKCAVVPTLFLYAIPLVGRISRSLKGVLCHDLLLAHLCNYSGMLLPGRTINSRDTKLLPCLVEEGISGNANCTDPNETSEISSKGDLIGLSGKPFSVEQCGRKGSNLDENSIQSIDFILKNVTEIWLLLQSERTHKARRMLRACEEELEMIAWNADGSIAALLAFVLYYVQIPFSGGLEQTKAEMLATGNSSENPLPFISGLPVGITFNITLYNVWNKDTLWLQMAVGKSVQYVFLNLSQFDAHDSGSTCTVSLPFYATPNAASFLLRACVCMECQIKGLMDCKKGQGGPRHDTILIS